MGELAGNCFRVHAVIYNHRTRDFYQLDHNGTLWECLAYLLSNLGEHDEPQIITIVKDYSDKCVEAAVLEELSIYGDSIDEDLREKYEPAYCLQYMPPKAEVKYPYITIRENPTVEKIVKGEG